MEEHVRDKRASDWFWMNNSILDSYGPFIGSVGIAVYAMLARCANGEGHAFPSVRYIARHLDLSTNTVLKYIEKLQEAKLIICKLRKDKAGDRDTSEYILLTPRTDTTFLGVSINETPALNPAPKARKKKVLNQEVSQPVQHGVSATDTPTQVSQPVQHGVSASATPHDVGVSQILNGGVSATETFDSLENQKPTTQDLNPPPLPPVEPQGGVEAGEDRTARLFKQQLKDAAKEVLAYLNQVTTMKFKKLTFIEAILDADYTGQQCKLVIDWWDKVWTVNHPQQRDFFNASTPFKKDLFEDYLPQAEKWEEDGRPYGGGPCHAPIAAVQRPSYTEAKHAREDAAVQRFLGGNHAGPSGSPGVCPRDETVINDVSYRVDG